MLNLLASVGWTECIAENKGANMADKKREELMIRMQAGLRGLSEEEMAERQRKGISEIRPMTNEELAERQRCGLQNIWGKMPGEA